MSENQNGFVMKNIAHSPINLGLLVIALAGSLGTQVPALGQSSGSIQPTQATVALAQPPASSTNKPHDNSFVIGNDDLLSINVWKEPDISRSIPVRSDGRISLPLVGEVQAAGQTPLQLEQEIASRLKSYIAEPEVTVIVQQINSEKFNILGQVAKPGSYSLTSGMTVLDAIAAAGGFRDFAKQKGIYVLRSNTSGAETRIAFNYKDVVKGKSSEQNIKLEPRDTIIVP
ncbi:MAG TPA: polysaccharide biosynthesis/export family protein [Pseudacidobacterium sp.]|nr:polysaccharide biosynthesis/export family protein [Pseudacidobacterium sp.]